MNREIKFRAWDKVNKQWFTLGNVVIDLNGIPYHKYLHDKMPFLEIVFFTGLKDKNGVEIYEGDIVNFHCNYTTIDKGCGQWLNGIVKHVVEKSSRFALFVNDIEYDMAEETEEFPYTAKVIGNVFENS